MRRRYHDTPQPDATMIVVQTDAGIATRWMTEEPICGESREGGGNRTSQQAVTAGETATLSQNSKISSGTPDAS